MASWSSLTFLMSGKRFLRASLAVMDMPEVLLKWYRILYQKASDMGGPASGSAASGSSRRFRPGFWHFAGISAGLAFSGRIERATQLGGAPAGHVLYGE